MGFTTPILLCVFNRPHLTERVFAEIRRQQPQRLLLVSDGPRETQPGESRLVQQTRQIISQVDWDCQVSTNFSDTNMGCRDRMASGISWAFDQVESLIVLEDDCLPSQEFFDFCAAMLQQYEQDDRVGMICGDQFLPHRPTTEDAYFSKYPFVWGWASWKRAWQHYDLSMRRWPKRNADWLSTWSACSSEEQYWHHLFSKQAAGEIDTWDYSWIFNSWDKELLTIHPAVNLVSNIGFGHDATHTTDAGAAIANLAISQSENLGEVAGNRALPRKIYRLPSIVQRDHEIDHQLFEHVFRPSLQTMQETATRRMNKLEKLNRWWNKKLSRWTGQI